MNTTERFQKHVLPTYGRFPISPIRGSGCRIWDEDERCYLDFCSGIAVCSLGHCHPRVTEAICNQAKQLLHCSNLYQIPQQAQLAEEINTHHVQIPGKVFFSNSGAEANDGLIKSARKYGHLHPQPDGKPRFEVLTFHLSFHGRTLGAMSATGQAKIQDGFAPLLQGFRYLPFNDIATLTESIRPETVAILMEPIQGEGGVNSATPEFMRAAEELCKKHNLLLLFDEVQVGFSRCGTRMGWRSIAPEIRPDGISWAKGMGGGVPIGAFWLNDRPMPDGAPLSSIMSAGSHGSTYGGNPLVCAASLEVLKTMREENLDQHALEMESFIRTEITSWNHPAIETIRGHGLLLGIALRAECIAAENPQAPALTVVKQLLRNGLLAPAAGPNTVRLVPPLNIGIEDTQIALGILRQTLDELRPA